MENQETNLQPNLHSSAMVRVFLVVVGTLFVIIGVIGIFLPILPTTPFMLLAAACYAKSSPRFYNWIIYHKLFGPIIREWREHRSIPRKAKNTAMLLMVVTFGSSIVFFVPIFYVQVGLTVFCIVMLIFMWRIPVREIKSKN